MELTQALEGRVTAVREGAFGGAVLPPIDGGLVITPPDEGVPIIAEVQSHLEEPTVRAIALQPTARLHRGGGAHATGAPLEVPVGDAIVGRLLDITGAGLPTRTWHCGASPARQAALSWRCAFGRGRR
jgi:F-type H+/Na+-transporting ATPase subunit beta